MVDHFTPEAPNDNDTIFNTIINLVTSSGKCSPIPAQWLRTRFFWSCSLSSEGIILFANFPNPVLTP